MSATPLTRFVLPSAQRLQQLAKLRTEIFGTAYNPESLRTGSKVLKARLRGPSMLRYYGDRVSGWKGLNAAVPNLELKDVHEETRCVSCGSLTIKTTHTCLPRADIPSLSASPPRSLARSLLDLALHNRLIDLETRRKRGKVTPKKGAYR